MPGRESEDRADGTIHVQPDAALTAEGCERGDRIDGAAHGCSGGGHHGQHRLPARRSRGETIRQSPRI